MYHGVTIDTADSADSADFANFADFAIVGAGPAGALTAALLARAGARVAIFDPTHPREKPCGGGVTRRALSHLAGTPALDSGLAAVPTVQVRTARFTDAARGVSTAVPLTQGLTPPLIVTSRAAFDGHLLASAQAVGATLHRSRVADIEKSGTGFVVRTADGRTWKASSLVGADGPNSLVRRRLLRPFRRDQLSTATGFFAHGVTSDEIVIEITTDPPGYIWSFPRPDHLAIGMCAQANAGLRPDDLADRCRRWIVATGIAPGATLTRYSWPIPSLSASDFDALDVAGRGFVLVGDAAGLVDPITREGIVHALHSATIAAGALLSSGPPARRYQQRIRDEIAPELWRAARFKAGFFTPRFSGLLLRALEQSEPIRRVMADLVAGEQSYRGLKWRLARTLELGLIRRLVLPDPRRFD